MKQIAIGLLAINITIAWLTLVGWLWLKYKGSVWAEDHGECLCAGIAIHGIVAFMLVLSYLVGWLIVG